MDWRTTMHTNGLLSIFQECLHRYYSWKIVRKLFACMVIPQSMWSLKVSNLGDKSVPYFKKKINLSTWIAEEPCMQIDFRQFTRNNMYVSSPGKLSEIRLHAWLFSNPCGKVLIIVGISWTPDLRVQHKQTS